MADRGPDDEASMADLPWGSVFDPSANIRALSAIQARGFRAASEVVNRFLRLADSDFFVAVSEENPGDGDGGTARPTTPDLEKAWESWQNVLTRLADSLRPRTSDSSSADAAVLDLMTAEASGRVSFDAAEAGATSTEVWLHNRGPEDLGKVRLRCGDLLAHDGSVVNAACIRFEPDVVTMLPRCSRGVTVEVDVAQDQPPGCYRGILLADGHAGVWLPVVLNLKPQVS